MKDAVEVHRWATVSELNESYFPICVYECVLMTDTESLGAEYVLCQSAFCFIHTWI